VIDTREGGGGEGLSCFISVGGTPGEELSFGLKASFFGGSGGC